MIWTFCENCLTKQQQTNELFIIGLAGGGVVFWRSISPGECVSRFLHSLFCNCFCEFRCHKFSK